MRFHVAVLAMASLMSLLIPASQASVVQFAYTGAMQDWVVPLGVNSVSVQLWGAQGGSNFHSVAGGLGGYATGTLIVTPGDVLHLFVGGMGGDYSANAGGFNGGASGGQSGSPNSIGGGGGGASDIRIGGTGLLDRMIVAGGGGGAGGSRIESSGPGTGGGGGGGYYGGGGGGGYDGSPGTGGTQTVGGTGGIGNFGGQNGASGILGLGGQGGNAPVNNQASTNVGPAGGDGGGLIGATGGSGNPNWRGGGGGGGSSYLGSASGASTLAGVRSGNGLIEIEFVASQPVPEPASMCIWACLGFAALLFKRRVKVHG